MKKFAGDVAGYVLAVWGWITLENVYWLLASISVIISIYLKWQDYLKKQKAVK